MKHSPQDHPAENYGSYTDQRQEAQSLRYGPPGKPMMPSPRDKEKACGSGQECPAEYPERGGPQCARCGKEESAAHKEANGKLRVMLRWRAGKPEEKPAGKSGSHQRQDTEGS